MKILAVSASKVSHLSKFLQHAEQLVFIDHSAVRVLALEGDLGGQLHALLRGRQACVALSEMAMSELLPVEGP